jgi:DNA-binding response OmpR family regulator
MVSEYLGEAGFRVSVAVGGRAGLERLAREPFDALVLDLMLPDMDGLEVCRELRARSDTPVLRFGSLEIDRDSRSVRVDGEERALTSYQFALLVALAENAGRVLSREALMDLVKGEPLEAFDRSIDVHVSRIRAAIEHDPKKPRRIVTVRGAGYVFAKAHD